MIKYTYIKTENGVEISYDYYFFNSTQVKVFPSAYRGISSTEPKIAYNPEARMLSEYATTYRPITHWKKNYIIESISGSDNKITLKLVIGGYYFEISGLTAEDLLNIITNYPWFVIQTRNIDIGDTTNKTPVLSSIFYEQTITSTTNNTAEAAGLLDLKIGDNDAFVGLLLTGTDPTLDNNLINKSFLDFRNFQENLLPEISHGTGIKSLAINGDATAAVGNYSITTGINTKAIGNNSFAGGDNSYAINDQTISFGSGGTFNIVLSSTDTPEIYSYSIASAVAARLLPGKIISYNNSYCKIKSIDIANNSITLDKIYDNQTEYLGTLDSTICEVLEGIASGKDSQAFGFNTVASGEQSHSTGYYTIASGDYSHAEGVATNAIGNISHAEGSNTSAIGTCAHAEGLNTVAFKDMSHAEGNRTNASNIAAHAEGYNTSASGEASHTEGNNTTASKNSAHAEGNNSTASGRYSHAEGDTTTASNTASHTEGYCSKALGEVSHAEGHNASASGFASHAEGHNTNASGNVSHAEGLATVSNHKAQHVFGEYNIEDPNTAANTEHGTYVEIVGNGNSSQRNNARTLDWSGNEWLAGNLTANSLLPNINNSYNLGDNTSGSEKLWKNLYLSGTAIIPEGNITTANITTDNTTTANIINANITTANITTDNITTANITTANITTDNTTTANITQLNVSTTAGNGVISNLVPSVNTSKSLGSQSYQWKNIYVGDANISANLSVAGIVDSNLIPNGTSNLYTVGNASNKWQHIYTEAITIGNRRAGTTIGTNSFAQGKEVAASGEQSHSAGYYTTASGCYSHAEGYNTSASNNASHAEGFSTIASGNYSHAEGANTTASDDYSHAEGYNTSASGSKAHAEGYDTNASSTAAHAEGYNTSAKLYAHSEGRNTSATGDCSHAEGRDTKATKTTSHAEGYLTKASGKYSHAEGYNTSAANDGAHTEGYYTVAIGCYSHAEGANTTASGCYSHAEGFGTRATHLAQHVFGEHNIDDPNTSFEHNRGDYIEIVGNGDEYQGSEEVVIIKSNARTLDWSGNEWLSGNLTVCGGTNTAGMGYIHGITDKVNISGTGYTMVLTNNSSGTNASNTLYFIY